MLKKTIFNINGKKIHLLSSTKFKTNCAIISFIGVLNRENILLRTMLSRVIANSCQKYPTKAELANCIYSLYDSGISVRFNSSYQTSFINFVVGSIHDKFSKEDDLNKNVFSLLYEIIFKPNIINNGFDERTFNEEKRLLIDEIKNVYNNKSRYAYIRLMQIMAKEDLVSLYNEEIMEQLEKINSQQLYDFYLEMLKKDQVEVYITGDLDEKDVRNYLSSFTFNNVIVEKNLYSPTNVDVTTVTQKCEYQDINQAKLAMGFRVHASVNDENYAPLIVFNVMFGGMFGSTLFRVVREEHSLAYDIYSRLIWENRIMIVAAGVDNNKDDLTSDLIIKQLEQYKQGKVDERLLQEAKDFLIADLNEISDNQYGTLYFEFKESLQEKRTVADLIKMIKTVNIEDVIRACQKIYLDTIFVLKAGEEDE